MATKTTSTEVKTTVRVTLELTDDVLLDALRNKLQLGRDYKVERAVYVIPRGGDYSGMSIPCSEMQLDVTVVKVEKVDEC